MIIDAHAHIYPEKIARRASDAIGKFYDLNTMCHDGTVQTLLKRMDIGGIDRALVHSAAMSPHQVRTINEFIIASVAQHPDRFIGFATLHPDMENVREELDFAVSHGLKGVKIHSDMIRIALDDPRMDKIYEACEGVCPLLLHMGDDRFHYDNPSMIPAIAEKYPRLKLVCAHMGGYREWENAKGLSQYENVYVDTSSTFFVMGCRIKEMIESFGEDKVFFGSDYPMWDPCVARDELKVLGFEEEALERIFSRNLLKMLGMEEA